MGPHVTITLTAADARKILEAMEIFLIALPPLPRVRSDGLPASDEDAAELLEVQLRLVQGNFPHPEALDVPASGLLQ